MEDRFAGVREEYETEGLRRDDLDPDPFRQFSTWYREAEAAGVAQPNAMVLATVSADGRPSARAVLLKGFDGRGFSFYTNLGSRKGRELRTNPNVALCFTWLDLHRQIRIEGIAETLPDEDADRYWSTRPHGAQLAAAASLQSRPVHDRAELEQAYAEILEAHPEPPVPRPDLWRGTRVVPDLFEFWQGRTYRLHDRFQYTGRDAAWTITRLAP